MILPLVCSFFQLHTTLSMLISSDICRCSLQFYLLASTLCYQVDERKTTLVSYEQYQLSEALLELMVFHSCSIFVTLHWTHSSKSIFSYKAPHARCGLNRVGRGQLSAPWTCWSSAPNTAQGAAGHHCYKGTLLAHSQPFAQQNTQGLLCQHSCPHEGWCLQLFLPC